ncbi:MAG: DUF92 domain-containing protein [Chloroflexia bacterium]
MDLALSYVIAGVIGYLGYRARALTWDGAVAACLVGGTIFGFGGPGWAVLLVVFFVSSSLLSFVGRHDPRKQRASEAFEKGGRLDAWQVLANGGVAAVAALGAGVARPTADLIKESQLVTVGLLFGAFVGALAAASADTWATEIGVLSRTSPRLVTTWRKVQAGTSGGVTVLGSVVALLGAGLIGLAAIALCLVDFDNLIMPFLFLSFQCGSLLLAALAGGALGMLVDSVLGATVQAQYVCPSCNKPTESRVHKCGTATTLVRGVRWINNDVVNLAGTLVGALVGMSIAAILPIAVSGIL